MAACPSVLIERMHCWDRVRDVQGAEQSGLARTKAEAEPEAARPPFCNGGNARCALLKHVHLSRIRSPSYFSTLSMQHCITIAPR